MPANPAWKGHLQISLVSIPVKAYNATASGADVGGAFCMEKTVATTHRQIQNGPASARRRVPGGRASHAG
jgi:non-homologous end joining protein Ku